MNRIFAALAILTACLLATNIFTGLVGGDYNGRFQDLKRLRSDISKLESAGARPDSGIAELNSKFTEKRSEFRSIRQRASSHMLIGVFAAIVTVLVSSMSATYFVGTSRWCKEVTQAYGLDTEYAKRASDLKRRSFRWSVIASISIIVVVALGAASDPGTRREGTAAWVVPHMVAAMIGTSVIAWSLWLQFRFVRDNHEIIQAVMRAVRRKRLSRGLDVEPAEPG